MGNGMDKVLPGLYMGSFRDSKDMEQLTRNGITHVVAIHDNAERILDHLQYKCIRIADSSDQNILSHFQECVDFIHKCRVEGGACLVHCIAGVSRSATIVAAYIMSVTSMNWRESLRAIKCARSVANPNYGFQRQLQDFYNKNVDMERERLKKLFPNANFNDEDYLKSLLLKEGKENEGDFDDSVLSTLNLYQNRTKFPNENDKMAEDSGSTAESAADVEDKEET